MKLDNLEVLKWPPDFKLTQRPFQETLDKNNIFEMRFYNNLFCINVYILKTLKVSDTEYTSVLYVGANLMLHLALFIGILGKILHIHFFDLLPSKYDALFVAIPLLIILLVYYSKSKRKSLLNEFSKKTKESKTIWGFISITSLVAPLVLFGVLFTK